MPKFLQNGGLKNVELNLHTAGIYEKLFDVFAKIS